MYCNAAGGGSLRAGRPDVRLCAMSPRGGGAGLQSARPHRSRNRRRASDDDDRFHPGSARAAALAGRPHGARPHDVRGARAPRRRSRPARRGGVQAAHPRRRHAGAAAVLPQHERVLVSLRLRDAGARRADVAGALQRDHVLPRRPLEPRRHDHRQRPLRARRRRRGGPVRARVLADGPGPRAPRRARVRSRPRGDAVRRGEARLPPGGRHAGGPVRTGRGGARAPRRALDLDDGAVRERLLRRAEPRRGLRRAERGRPDGGAPADDPRRGAVLHAAQRSRPRRRRHQRDPADAAVAHQPQGQAERHAERVRPRRRHACANRAADRPGRALRGHGGGLRARARDARGGRGVAGADPPEGSPDAAARPLGDDDRRPRHAAPCRRAARRREGGERRRAAHDAARRHRARRLRDPVLVL